MTLDEHARVVATLGTERHERTPLGLSEGIAHEARERATDLSATEQIDIAQQYDWSQDDQFDGPLDAIDAWGADELHNPLVEGLEDLATYALRRRALERRAIEA